MWTDITRAHHARDGLRLPSDLTDREWALISPHLPARSRLGRPARWSLRRIVDPLMYLPRGALPPRFFTDYLVLLKLTDGWRIVSKAYRYEVRE